MTQNDGSNGMTKPEVEGAVYKTLLESTKAIPWKIDWTTMRFAYIGPQIEALLGWTPESWVTVQDWADRIHPDDRQWVVDYCVAQSKSGVDHEADYRALAKDGSFVWLRDVVHVIRTEDGTVEALVGFMFDISERKRNEERVKKLEAELEQLSFRDSVSGLANRRWLETLVDAEWAIAVRSQSVLSVVIVEIDFFREYANHYGLPQANACLRSVAEILKAAATRPRDFLARHDEGRFVIVLPETDEAGAVRVAERSRELLSNEAIPHDRAPSKRLSVRALARSVVPSRGDEVGAFIESIERVD